jgi:hypothetical protein
MQPRRASRAAQRSRAFPPAPLTQAPLPSHPPSTLSLHPLPSTPLQEAAVSRAEHERSIVRANAARDRQLKQMQDHNVVTKLPYVEQPPPPPPKEASRTYASGAPWHILSGDPLPQDLQSDAARTFRPPRPLINYTPSLVRRRAVDILSNKYLADDASRQQRDAARARDTALRRYWQTHNFDPITQTYYDPDKEAAAREIAELSKTVQGQAQRARLPPSVRICTGAGYDIVGHLTKDAEVLNTVDLMDTRPLRVRTRVATEERLHSAGEAAAAVADVRATSRMRQRRYEEFSDPRGYDVISNQARDPAVAERTLAGKELRPWERVARDLQSAPAGLV